MAADALLERGLKLSMECPAELAVDVACTLAADLKNEIHARYDPAAGRLVVWGRINEEITEKYGEDGG